jgi:hypothetical protein
MPRAPLLWVAACACIVAPLAQLTGLHSPLRVAGALLLFCLAPGMALLPRLSPRPAYVELGLVVGFSLAVCAVLAQSMLWLGAWSPTAATCVLAAACMALIAPQLGTEGGGSAWRSR